MPALASVLVALLVGLLIGLDRERAEARKGRNLFAGVRTFPLIALAGALPMLLVAETGPALVVTSFLAVGGIVLASYVRTFEAGSVGATTEIAAIITFLLGALAGGGHLGIAGAVGVMVTVLLAAKPPLEAFSRALSTEELTAALQLAVISVIVLPVLPDQGFGPWEVLNPRRIWLVVVLVSALSFAGFVAMRLLGEGRGTVVTGAVGGLVSSTAVTLAMAERSRVPAAERAAAAATVLASTVMCARVAVLAGATNVRVLPPLGPVIAAMAVVGCVGAWILLRGGTRGPAATATVRNPFSLTAALGFAAVYAGVLLFTRAAAEYLGDRGLYASAVLSGVADVDAPTLAFARLAGTSASLAPVVGIVLAALANTLVKLGLAVGLGAGRFRWQVATALGTMALAGAGTAALTMAAR